MISPQGYQLGADPKNKNPFWDEGGEDSSVNRIYATATVDDKTGVPKVDTSKTVSGSDITFNFGFHNIKGEKGETGPEGPAGPGVPAGGTAGQILTKVDGTDYNTEWMDPKRSSSDINFKIYETEVQVSEWTHDTSTDMYYCEVPENSELVSILMPYLKDPEHSVSIPENKCLSVVVTRKESRVSAGSSAAYNYITNISVNNRSVSVSLTASRTFLALEAPYKPVTGKYNIKVLYYE